MLETLSIHIKRSKLIVVMVAQHGEHTENHWIVYFKKVNSVVCELYLNKSPIFFKKMTKLGSFVEYYLSNSAHWLSHNPQLFLLEVLSSPIPSGDFKIYQKNTFVHKTQQYDWICSCHPSHSPVFEQIWNSSIFRKITVAYGLIWNSPKVEKR